MPRIHINLLRVLIALTPATAFGQGSEAEAQRDQQLSNFECAKMVARDFAEAEGVADEFDESTDPDDGWVTFDTTTESGTMGYTEHHEEDPEPGSTPSSTGYVDEGSVRSSLQNTSWDCEDSTDAEPATDEAMKVMSGSTLYHEWLHGVDPSNPIGDTQSPLCDPNTDCTRDHCEHLSIYWHQIKRLSDKIAEICCPPNPNDPDAEETAKQLCRIVRGYKDNFGPDGKWRSTLEWCIGEGFLIPLTVFPIDWCTLPPSLDPSNGDPLDGLGTNCDCP